MILTAFCINAFELCKVSLYLNVICNKRNALCIEHVIGSLPKVVIKALYKQHIIIYNFIILLELDIK